MNRRLAILRFLIPALVFAGALGAFVGGRYALTSFPLDDAWIHRVYSRSLAEGRGFAYNTRQEAGSTSPLWSIVTAPAEWAAGGDPERLVLIVKGAGALLALTAVLGVAGIASLLFGSPLAGAVAGSVFSLEPRLLFAALSGMEGPLLAAVWIGAAAALLGEAWLAGACLLGLAVVARPEAGLLLPLAVPAVLTLWRAGRRPTAALAVGAALTPGLLWSAFCLWATGHPLPNTFYMKATAVAGNLKQVGWAWHALGDNGFAPPLAVATGLVLFVFAVHRAAPERLPAAAAAFLAAPTAMLLGVLLTRTVHLHGYFWVRWLDQATLMLSAAVAVAVGGAVALAGRAEFGGRLRVAAGAAAFLLVAASAPWFYSSFADRRNHMETDSRAIALMNVDTALWIASHTPADADIATEDAGAMRYFSGRRTLDIIGLNNAAVAFQRVSRADALKLVRWAIVFPRAWAGSPLMADIDRDFERRATFSLPVSEYTICDCASQAERAVFERKRP